MIGKSTPASTPRPTKSPDRWAIFTFLALAQLMIVLDTTVMNIAMPSVQSELEMSDGERQWTITAYALSFGGLLLLGGRVTDLLGHKRAFLVGLVGFALASALGGLLTEYTTWRWTLYVAVPIAALSFAGVTTLLKARAVPERGRRLDVLGALLVTLGLGVLVHGFSLAQTHGWASPSPLGLLTSGAVLLVAFVVAQTQGARAAAAVPDRPGTQPGWRAVHPGAAVVSMFGMFSYLTHHLQVVLDFSPLLTGVAFLPMVAGLVGGSTQVAGRLMTVPTPRVLMCGGLATATAGTMAVCTALVNASAEPETEHLSAAPDVIP